MEPLEFSLLKTFKVLALALVLLPGMGNVYATKYYLSPNSDPSVTSNWGTNTDGTGPSPGNFSSSHDFEIGSGITGILVGNWDLGGTTGASIITLTVNGTLVI
ncbi:MAG TPA: hypothetical protein VI583_13280, partial [Cyclobacteriaceae bacterium]|nr:hypothetical protein [Cyclobacteriaceae bacterium]